MFHIAYGVFFLDPQIQSLISVLAVKILVPDLDGLEGRESEERRCFGGNHPLLLPLQQLRLRGSESRRQVTLVVLVAAVLLAEEDRFTCTEVLIFRFLLMRLEAPVFGGILVVMELRFFRIILTSF